MENKNRVATKADKERALRKLKMSNLTKKLRRIYNIPGSLSRKDIALAIDYVAKAGRVDHYGKKKLTTKTERQNAKKIARQTLAHSVDLMDVFHGVVPGQNHLRYLDFQHGQQIKLLSRAFRDTLDNLNKYSVKMFNISESLTKMLHASKSTLAKNKKRSTEYKLASALADNARFLEKNTDHKNVIDKASNEVSQDIVNQYKDAMNKGAKKYYAKHPDKRPNVPVRQNGHTFASIKQAKKANKKSTKRSTKKTKPAKKSTKGSTKK